MTEEDVEQVVYEENERAKSPVEDTTITLKSLGSGSPLRNKILYEQLLERRAMRKIAELELKRKTLEYERYQFEYEREKTRGEIRWAHENRLMQIKEERERKLSQE